MTLAFVVSISALASVLATATTVPRAAGPFPAGEIKTGQETVFCGGGCRKSSPPGQCCHMDNSVGVPHCH